MYVEPRWSPASTHNYKRLRMGNATHRATSIMHNPMHTGVLILAMLTMLTSCGFFYVGWCIMNRHCVEERKFDEIAERELELFLKEAKNRREDKNEKIKMQLPWAHMADKTRLRNIVTQEQFTRQGLKFLEGTRPLHNSETLCLWLPMVSRSHYNYLEPQPYALARAEDLAPRRCPLWLTLKLS